MSWLKFHNSGIRIKVEGFKSQDLSLRIEV